MTTDTEAIDRFGYNVYAVVLFATPEQQASVEAMRDVIGKDRQYLRAHVTVKGTFRGIDDLDAIRSAVREIAAKHAPIDITFRQQEDWSPGGSIRVINIDKTPELEALHRALLTAIGPISENAYGEHLEGDGYRPHLTLYQDVSEFSATMARQRAQSLRIGEGFTAAAVDLVARNGPRDTGAWEYLQTSKLTG